MTEPDVQGQIDALLERMGVLEGKIDEAVEETIELRADLDRLAGVKPTLPKPPEVEGFRVTVTDRRVRTEWDLYHGKVEVHEFLTDPNNTLKAVMDEGTTARVSSALTPGKTYEWGVRGLSAEGQPGDWSQRIRTTIGASDNPPAPVITPTPGTGRHPTDVLPELKTWTVMLPTGSQGDPDNDYMVGRSVANTFFVGSDGGVVFRADANGVHSGGSLYARSEGRQMKDANWNKAAWSSSGNHTLECVLAFDTSHLKFRRVNGMQIHDGGDDVCQIMRHESLGLGFMHNDGKTFVSIDPNYQDGTKVRVKIEAAANVINVYYNGVKKVSVPKSGSGWYWKVGCYNQTGGAKVERPEPEGNYGEVRVYSLVTTGGGS